MDTSSDHHLVPVAVVCSACGALSPSHEPLSACPSCAARFDEGSPASILRVELPTRLALGVREVAVDIEFEHSGELASGRRPLLRLRGASTLPPSPMVSW